MSLRRGASMGLETPIMITVLVMGLLALADPALAQKPVHHKILQVAAAEQAPAKTGKSDKTDKANKAEKTSASRAEARAGTPMDPEVKRVVDGMQSFYEKTLDFEAQFTQRYTYVSRRHTQESTGTLLFRKPRKNKSGQTEAPAMRWDYQKPAPKTIIVTGGSVYMFDPEAQELTKAPLQLEKLSASVTFLWGLGKLDHEFFITRANRPDLAGGVALELIPKKADPRFDRVFMKLDPRTNAVVETVVVDPSGDENHMVFSAVKTDQGIGPERFHLEPPPGTQVRDMTQLAPKP
jgi:outer membrane lipoprotein carrier protein